MDVAMPVRFGGHLATNQRRRTYILVVYALGFRNL
jgi:hypothetical protein